MDKFIDEMKELDSYYNKNLAQFLESDRYLEEVYEYHKSKVLDESLSDDKRRKSLDILKKIKDIYTQKLKEIEDEIKEIDLKVSSVKFICNEIIKLASDVVDINQYRKDKGKDKEKDKKLLMNDPFKPYIEHYEDFFSKEAIRSFLDNSDLDSDTYNKSMEILKDVSKSDSERRSAISKLDLLKSKYIEIINSLKDLENYDELDKKKIYELPINKDYAKYKVLILYPSYDEHGRKYFDEKNGVKKEMTVNRKQFESLLIQNNKGDIRILDSKVRYASLEKSFWIAKVKGDNKWYKVLDIVDSKIPAHLTGGGNYYHLEGYPHPVNQADIVDLDEVDSESELHEMNKNAEFKKKIAQVNIPDLVKKKYPDEKKLKEVIDKAKKATPRYFDLLDINKEVLNKIKKALKTNADINDDEFYIKVIEYQLKNNLTPDGIIGPITYTSIRENFPELNLEEKYTTNMSVIEKRKMDEDFIPSRFKKRIGYIESRGRYDAVNPNTKALGKYQFIWRYWGDKIKAFAGRDVTPEEFLNDPDLQEKWMDFYIKNYLLPEVNKLLAQYPDAKYKGKEFLGAMLHFHGYSKVRDYLKTNSDPTKRTKINPITMTEYAEKALSIS